MKFRNIVKAFVPIGPRESVPPFGVTRDFTQEEVDKSPELRNAKERGYIVEWDGKNAPAPAVPARKAAYVTAPDTQGGDLTRTRTAGGKVVEYITATDVGVDSVENADLSETSLVASVDGQKPADFIEDGHSATPKQTKWVNASEAFESELNQETTEDLEFDDNKALADGEDDRVESVDAESAISEDYSQVLQNQGNQGSSVMTTKEIVQDAAAAASAGLEQAVNSSNGNLDDGEDASGVSKDTADFLKQNFAAKKWLLSKTSDHGFLKEVSSHTKSQNVKALADQRLSEIEKSA